MLKRNAPLSKREAKVWEYLLKYFADYGYSPTRQEIANGVGFSHRNHATECIVSMIKKGWLKLNERLYRNIVDPAELSK
jgi:SOS-response transcriptional repressor LexA